MTPAKKKASVKKAAVVSKFVKMAPDVMKKLMADFELNSTMAAGILGNIGVESDGFRAYHQYGQPEGKGGYGWCQWTASRRKTFFEYCDQHGLDRMSDDASYGYLSYELNHSPYQNAIGALQKTKTLEEAVMAFERNFEKAGEPNYSGRNKYAKTALAAYNSSL